MVACYSRGVRAIGNIGEDRVEQLQAATDSLTSLDHVVRWALAEGLELADVIAMDEYTHDVVVPLPDGLVLVFDCT